MGTALESATGDAFPELARQLFGNVRLDFADDPLDRRRLRSATFGDCRVSALDAGAHTVTGEQVARASDSPDALKLLIQTQGSSLLRQSGRAVEFGDGTPVIYDPTRPYALLNRTPVSLVMLQLPRRHFSAAALAALAAPVVPDRNLSGLWNVLLAMLRSSLAESGDLDLASREKLGTVFVDMVLRLVGGAAPAGSPLDILLLRCKAFVDANLECPGLDVHRIAAHVGCSARYVFRAFEMEDSTPAQYIWQTRLARARHDLASAASAGRSITELAFSLGFSSSAHFSRAFRARFGTSPRDYRRAALDELISLPRQHAAYP